MNFYDRLKNRSAIAHRRFQASMLVAALLLILIACGWNSGLGWFAAGMLFMFLPVAYTHTSRVLDLELLRDKAGFEPRKPGRHSGAHPHPGARNRG